MFEKLFDLLGEWRDIAMPFTVIDSYEAGVIMRLGNCRKVVTSKNGTFGTGFHWKWPFIEKDITEPVMPRIVSWKGKSLMTADGKNIVVGLTLAYRVADVRKALLDVHDADNCLDDIGNLVAARVIQQFNYVDLTSDLFAQELLSNAKDKAAEYGIDVIDIGLSEIALARTIRLVGGT